MNLAVLRVVGDGAVVRALLARDQLAVDCAWYAGEIDSSGCAHAESGFNATVADAQSTSELVHLVDRWSAGNEPFLRELATAGAVATLDVGISVDAERPNSSVCFTPALLRRCAEVSVSLEVSACLSCPSDAPVESSESSRRGDL